MSHPKIVDLAWAAGILDGEGCFGISFRKNPGVHQMFIRVATIDDKMCPKLHELFGGSLWINKGQAGHSPQYIWQVTGKVAGEIAKQVQPYLIVKPDQAEICIKFAATIRGPGKRTKNGLYPVREPLRQELSQMHAERPLKGSL